MKKKLILIWAIFALSKISTAQTVNPSCYSNAESWKITKIENSDASTYVYLNYYSYDNSYVCWFNSGMYIESADFNSSKYYIRGVDNNQLDTRYKLEPFTEYDFVLRFDKIPDAWNTINIKEPPVQTGTSWHWNYIALNRPETQRYKLDNFFTNAVSDFLITYAHPLNTFKGYRYSVDDNLIHATIYYESGYHIDLKIYFDNNLVDRIAIVDDNDEFTPFASLTLLRNIIFKQRNGEVYASEFERRLNTAINQMNGRQLACVYLTTLWSLQ